MTSLNTDNRIMSIRSVRYWILIFLCGAMLSLALSCGGGGGSVYTVTTTPTMNGVISSISAIAGNGSVTVSWGPVTGATSYIVYSSLSSPVSHVTATKHIVSGTTFDDSGLTNGVPYYYVMTSIESGIESSDSSEVSAVPGDSGTISGTVLYEDKEYGISGFTGNTAMKAVRYATVEVVNVATSSVLNSTKTDSRGAYRLAVAAGPTVYVRVLSEAVPATAPVSVKNLSGAKYGMSGINLPLTGSASVNISAPSTNPAGGAFNILDVLTNGFEFVKHLSGAYPPVSLSAFWEKGNLNGTFYCTGVSCPSGDGIYVLNTTTDTDEYDDDVLYHEFGHFVATNFSRDDSPGGQHALSSNDLDMRLSWSEGWGDFFPAALKSWLWSDLSTQGLLSSAPGTELSRYVDTVSGGAGVSFNFATPPVNVSFWYATNEAAIAKILWDLQTNFTVQPIWSVVSSFTSTIPSTPVNLEAFWDAWYTLRSLSTATTELASVRSIYAARSINYYADPYEQDDSLATASTYTINVTPQQVRTLYSKSYPAADVDVVSFAAISGNAYTITTSNMLNGADTVILVSNPSGTVIAANDNSNGIDYSSGRVPRLVMPSLCDFNGICHDNRSDILGSHVSFVATTAGMHSVKIESSPVRPVSAGRYGSYTLTITSP